MNNKYTELTRIKYTELTRIKFAAQNIKLANTFNIVGLPWKSQPLGKPTNKYFYLTQGKTQK